MPKYSEEIIEEVRSRSDIVDVIQSYVQLKKKGSSYFGLCPFHNEKSPSFSVSRDKQMYYCFGCGAGGNVYSFLMNYENLTFPEAVQELANRAGIELPKGEITREEIERDKRRAELYAIQKDAAYYYYSLLRSERGRRGLDYFKGRQLSDETMKKFGLGYSDMYGNGLYNYLKSKGYSNDGLRKSGLVSFEESKGFSDRFWNRVMFPIMDKSSRVVAFGGRVMGDAKPKYLNSPETEIFDKGHILYGAHLARKSRRDMIILCEGYMDVISLHQAGFDNAMASLGTALTERNALELKKYRKDVYLSYDSDGAGVSAALRAINIFKKIGLSCRVINMRPYKDPDEFIKALGTEEYEKRIHEAENSFLYTIRMAEGEYRMDDPESKTAFQRYMANRVLEFYEEMERNNYISVLCDKYNMSADSFRALVAHEAAKGGSSGQGSMSGNNGQRSMPGGETDGSSGTYEGSKNLPRKRKVMNAEGGLMQSERLILSWMAYNKDIYEKLKPIIGVGDFSPGIHRDVAEVVFSDMEEGREPNPASLIDKYSEESEQTEIARIFHTDEELRIDNDKDKALREALIRVKRTALERENDLAENDADSFRKRLENRKFMEKLEKMTFI